MGDNWRQQVFSWLGKYAIANTYTKSYGGTDSWYALVNLDTDVIAYAPTHLFIECAVNDGAFVSGGPSTERANGWWPVQEALIRRIRTALPTTKIVFVNLVQQEEYAAVSKVQSRDYWLALCTKYAIEDYRIDLWLQDIIGTPTPSEAQCLVYGDFVHFTDAGHTQIYNMLLPHLSSWFPWDSADWSGTLTDYDPPYWADVADFEHSPIIRTGVDNDGETGTGWSTIGTARSSATANDTIYWTGTFSSVGFEITPQVGTVAWDIDGGGYTEKNITALTGTVYPLHSLARAEHTVTLKVISGTIRINKFLAV